ncbi:hypothetical protein BCV69DRAFT_313219 [Microstroma glucosiphilum]|uniref:Uncharacterized protein n=1 Tax=Pseudomicrostroma glucosiphilum TaxID=1684307 RepID=A0A316U6P8_9BASI|nr:hypothetical protein BCV69DRAFT_313219 [Pseudomicrostroma glucosiphilum]PWN20013.1 hypothetical protein BCV69DRAFT_313219 [Pseudomicrostroma glucosiphilum]
MDSKPGPSRLGPRQMLLPLPPSPSRPRRTMSPTSFSSTSSLPSMPSSSSSSSSITTVETDARQSPPLSSSSTNGLGKRQRRNKSTASMRRVWLATALAFIALSGQQPLLGASTAAAAPSPSHGESLEQRDTRFASSSPWKGKARDTSGAYTEAGNNGHFLAAPVGAGAGPIADAADGQERILKAIYPDRNGVPSQQAIVEASLERLSGSKVPVVHPTPSATTGILQRRDTPGMMNEHGNNVKRGTRLVPRQAAHAYASGIIADWTHQGRSVWFQRKAIIIVSCFLAIFIVLIIGAAAFLRSRQTEEELSLEEQENQELADEAALKRMKEERRMRSGGRRRRKDLDEDEKQDADELAAGKKKKKRMNGRRGNAMTREATSGSGSSTAVSRMRVSRWIKAPADFVRGNRGSGEQTLAGDTNDAASIRSSQSSSRRRQRLGDARTERTEVEYSTPPTTGGDGSDLQAVSSDPSSSSPTTSMDTSSGSGGSSSRAVALDASDFQAADAAGAAPEQVLPPAYIPAAGQSGSNLPPQSPPPVDGGNASLPRPEYQRPLAGSQVVTDAKHPSGPDMGPLPPPQGSSAVLLSDNVDETTNASREGAAHIATDDKARLAALAAAASAPATTSAPFYSSRGAASAPTEASDASPSAPALDVDEDGFEQDALASLAGVAPSTDLDGRASSQVAPSYTRANDSRVSAGSSGESAQSSLLPQPPRPHNQAFSPFDRPYHHMMPYTPSPSRRDESNQTMSSSVPQSSTSPTTVPDAAGSLSSPSAPSSSTDDNADEEATMSAERKRRRAEKQREADEESALSPSSPGDFAAGGLGLGSAGAAAAGISLPAYSGRSSYGGAGADAGAGAGADAATATAPAIETLFEEDESAAAPPDVGDYGATTDTPAPSAPPHTDF